MRFLLPVLAIAGVMLLSACATNRKINYGGRALSLHYEVIVEMNEQDFVTESSLISVVGNDAAVIEIISSVPPTMGIRTIYLHCRCIKEEDIGKIYDGIRQLPGVRFFRINQYL
ncbi:MAG TPA: hypothetical protein VHM26_08480 [Chitinophagaceae bacterium]|jgi:hypothetical protein|nr:hypothetical protein [Chitinophagaceae bacterium]